MTDSSLLCDLGSTHGLRMPWRTRNIVTLLPRTS